MNTHADLIRAHLECECEANREHDPVVEAVSHADMLKLLRDENQKLRAQRDNWKAIARDWETIALDRGARIDRLLARLTP